MRAYVSYHTGLMGRNLLRRWSRSASRCGTFMPLLRSCAFASADFGSSGLVTFSFAGSNPRLISWNSENRLWMLTRLPSTQHCKDHLGRFRIPEAVEDPCQGSRSPNCPHPVVRQWLRRCSGPWVAGRQRYSRFHKPPDISPSWQNHSSSNPVWSSFQYSPVEIHADYEYYLVTNSIQEIKPLLEDGPQDLERRNTRLTENSWAAVICVKDEDMVIWSTGNNLTTASFDGIFVTQNCCIEIAHRHIRSRVILKTTSSHKTYLWNSMINIWALGFVEYFPWIRIVFTIGYVIVHEDHYIVILQAPFLQDLIRMANISLPPTVLMMKLYQHIGF